MLIELELWYADCAIADIANTKDAMQPRIHAPGPLVCLEFIFIIVSLNKCSGSDTLNGCQPLTRTEAIAANEKDCPKPTLLPKTDIVCLNATLFFKIQSPKWLNAWL